MRVALPSGRAPPEGSRALTIAIRAGAGAAEEARAAAVVRLPRLRPDAAASRRGQDTAAVRHAARAGSRARRVPRGVRRVARGAGTPRARVAARPRRPWRAVARGGRGEARRVRRGRTGREIAGRGPKSAARSRPLRRQRAPRGRRARRWGAWAPRVRAKGPVRAPAARCGPRGAGGVQLGTRGSYRWLARRAKTELPELGSPRERPQRERNRAVNCANARFVPASTLFSF